MRALLKQALKVIYPPLCLSCRHPTEDLRQLFCPSCMEHLTLIDPRHRCRRCFSGMQTEGICSRCRTQHSAYRHHAAACERFGPALALLSHFQQGEFMLASAIASLMVMQHHALGWPTPDWIIPYPTHLFPLLSPQGKLNRSVAGCIAKMLERPLSFPLKRSIDWDYFTQDPPPKEPIRLARVLFKENLFADKTLLLISLDTDLTGLSQAANLLQEVFPKQIDSLSFLLTQAAER